MKIVLGLFVFSHFANAGVLRQKIFNKGPVGRLTGSGSTGIKTGNQLNFWERLAPPFILSRSSGLTAEAKARFHSSGHVWPGLESVDNIILGNGTQNSGKCR